MKKVVRMSISLDKDFKKKLTYLSELEHRRLNQQIVHMTEFYLKHQVETKKLLEQFIQHRYELEASIPNSIDTKANTQIEIQGRFNKKLKTSQVLQENKGIIVSDVPDKKVKSVFENLSS